LTGLSTLDRAWCGASSAHGCETLYACISGFVDGDAGKVLAILVSTARQKRTCNGNDDACTTKEKYSSRWEDMKLSMFLLGNAFRTDSGKPPEKVKQVKEAKAFFGQVDKLQKARMKGDRKGTALAYAASIEALEAFLNDVDLPPTFAPDYKEAADQEVPSLCQGSFCI